jgi:hypothetical protein
MELKSNDIPSRRWQGTLTGLVGTRLDTGSAKRLREATCGSHFAGHGDLDGRGKLHASSGDFLYDFCQTHDNPKASRPFRMVRYVYHVSVPGAPQ